MWFRVGLARTVQHVVEIEIQARDADEAEAAALQLAKRRGVKLAWQEGAPAEFATLVIYQAEGLRE